MRAGKHLNALYIGVCLGLTAVSAHAALDIVTHDAQGLPGSVVFPSLAVNLSGEHDLVSMLFGWEYDQSFMQFEPDLAKVQVMSHEYSLSAFIDVLKAVGQIDAYPKQINPGTGREFYRYIFTSLSSSFHAGGEVTFVGAFWLKDDAPVGIPLPISVGGDFGADDLEDAFGGVVNVTAVPEPETWVLWLGGLGLVALRRLLRKD